VSGNPDDDLLRDLGEPLWPQSGADGPPSADPARRQHGGVGMHRTQNPVGKTALRHHRRPAASGLGGTPRRRSWLVALVALLVGATAAGSYLAFGRGGGRTAMTTLAPPPCTHRVASGTTLSGVPSHLTRIGGDPFDVVTAGRYGFVSVGNGVAVMNTSGSAPSLIRTVRLAAANGEDLTPDGKYLLVTGESGMTVFRVSKLESGSQARLGSLASPGGRRGVEVVTSPDGRFAFVTLQDSGQLAVFNLRQALTRGFGPADLVRVIRTGPETIGITTSADGRYLYLTQGLGNDAAESGHGGLLVLDMRRTEAKSGDPVVSEVAAGCGPARVLAAPDGKHVWVTVGGGNALLCYSAAMLLRDPGHALVARVAVGQIPLGLVLVNNGQTIVVADSNRDHIDGSRSDLAVVSVSRALAHRPALMGVLGSGLVPRQFALTGGGSTLLITNTGSGQLQAVNVDGLLPRLRRTRRPALL